MSRAQQQAWFVSVALCCCQRIGVVAQLWLYAHSSCECCVLAVAGTVVVAVAVAAAVTSSSAVAGLEEDALLACCESRRTSNQRIAQVRKISSAAAEVILAT